MKKEKNMANVENEQIQETNSESTTSEADKKLANMINSAVSSQLKRVTGKMSESFESMLQEKLQGLTPSQSSAPKEKSKEESEVAKLRQELAAEKRANLEKEVYSGLKEKLVGKVRPEAVSSALKILKADGHIDFSKKEPVFRFGGEELDLDSGLETWLENSEDAKLFKPAPQGQVKKSPFKAPTRSGANSSDQNKTPLQKTIEQLTAKGLRLGS
jgi:hypothetical protein